MRRTAILAILSMLAALLAVASPLSAQEVDGVTPSDRYTRASGVASSDFELRSPDDIVQVFIQFDEPAVAEVAAQGASGTAQQDQGRAVLAQQSRMRNVLSDFIVDELSSMQVGANGVRVTVRAGDVPAIRGTDGVLSVAGVTRHHINNADSVPWIGGNKAKRAGYTGKGVTIAIIDTGIDYTHAAFGGSGDPADYENNQTGIIEPGTFPTEKVIGGFDFAGPNYNPCGDPAIETPSPDADPLDVHGHGTHVAGTAAGLKTPGHGAGMAPDAKLFAYKVFGDITGCTDLVSDALERALDPNNDLDTSDHVDVVNMSLGSDYGDPNDPSAIATQNAVDLGIVVVAASGNAGNIPYITGSPAVEDTAISVAASIDEGYFLNAIEVTSPEEIAGIYEAAIGDFGSVSEGISGDLAIAEPFDACEDADNGQITNPEELEDQIALIVRGTCSFSAKVRAAQEAGAVAAVVINNAAGAPIIMGQDGTPDQPSIAAVMIRQDNGGVIAATAAEETVTVTLTDEIVIPQPELADQMASFSSRGPGQASTFKPDVSAPGFGIISAAVGSGDGGASSNGTSMATPHIAGLAAQVLQKYPHLDPAGVKALIMNSARPAAPEGLVPLARQGTGVAQADVALLSLKGYASPGGVSFGRINPTQAGSATESFTVTRLTTDTTYNVEFVPNTDLPGVTWSVPGSVTTAGKMGEVAVTLSWDPAGMDPDDANQSQVESDGWVVLTNSANPNDTIVVGVMGVLDPASEATASGGEGEFTVANDGAALGPAWGYTLLAEGGGASGSLDAVGYTTFELGGGVTGIDLGLAVDQYVSPNLYEVDIWIDVDGDGEDDYVALGIDQGVVTSGSFNGVFLTGLVDLSTGDLSLHFVAGADFNDGWMSLPVLMDHALGFNPPSDTFDIDIVVWDLRQEVIVGMIEDLTIDLGTEITSESGLAFNVPGGVGATFPVDGSGDLLWLFPNNQFGSQYAVTTITEVEVPEPEPGTGDFDDVPEDHLFFTEIGWLAEEDITRGCNPPANTLFCPDGEVTRGQMAAFLVRALDLPGSATDHFEDDNGHLFEAEINALAEAGITRGCNPPANTNFCPNSELSRAEMATFMQRAFDLDASSTDWFEDDDGNIHESAINAIADADITRGCNPPANTNFCPNNNITRGQMAAFLYRAFHNAPN